MTSPTAYAPPTPPQVATATKATYAAFIGAGFATASWASRIPQIRDQLQLTPASLGLVLLAVAGGSLIALPLAGIIVHRFNSRRTVAAMSMLLSVGLIVLSTGYLIGVLPVLVGFALIGFANGAWDVAMNVQGATVERHLGRAIMPRFHAGFSVGTVAGALLGAAMVALKVPVTAHLIGVAAVIALYIPIAVRGFVADTDDDADRDPTAAKVSPLARWKEPRTLLIGVFVLAFAFAEGTGNDWINIALIDGYGAPVVVGTLGFATFLAAMTGGRWFGPALLDRFGRVAVTRWLALVAVIGLLIFVFSPSVPLAFVGTVLWGVGASLGFPVGMSAASDDPRAAATRVSVVASIGYCAFLGGPPLIGFLGNNITVLKALTVVAVLMAVAAMVAGAVRPIDAGAAAEPNSVEP
jgi:MFS family permease